MKTFLYIKKFNEIPQDIAHLYEHAVIESFYELLKKKFNINPGVSGYMGGEVHHNVIYIEAWFYDAKIAESFQKFIEESAIDKQLISLALRQCEAERREDWKIEDQKLLFKQLDALGSVKWTHIDSVEASVHQSSEKVLSPIKTKKNSSAFKSITISLYLSDSNIQEKALFLRLSVIINDIIDQYINERGWYVLGSHSPVEKGEYTFRVLSVSMPKGAAKTKGLEVELERLLHSFDVRKHMPYIEKHFKEFENQPLWVGHAKDHIHHTGVIASNQQIASLATEENVTKLFKEISIRIENVPFKFARNLEYPEN